MENNVLFYEVLVNQNKKMITTSKIHKDEMV